MSRPTSATLLALTAVTVAALLPATAGAGWGARESVAPGEIQRIYIAPGGPAFLVGFGVTPPSRYRYATRPWDGPLGAPLELPGDSGQGGDTVNFDFDAAGNAIISNPLGRRVAYRSADGQTTTAETMDLDANNQPVAVSVAPSGEAMLGFQGSGVAGGAVKVAFRAAGPVAAVDEAQAESFSTSGKLIGLQLQADGGAIVVWQEGDVMKQAVRPGGGVQSFGPPSVINAPGPDPRKFIAAFDGDSSGWAMLSWYGSSATGPFLSDRAFATVRAPDGSFPDATLVGSGPRIVNTLPSITSAGNGFASWSQVLDTSACPANAAMGATYQNGAWAPAAPLGPSAWPDISAPGTGDVATSAGSRIAYPYIAIHDDTPCTGGGETRKLMVRHFHGAASGLVDDGTSELAPLEFKPQTDPPVALQPFLNDFTVEPSGKILAYYRLDASNYLRAFDGVPPGPADPAPPAAAGPSPAPSPIAAPAPAPAPAPKIVPILPKQYVTIIPIDPATLSLAFNCTVEDVGNGECNLRAQLYYGLTGKLPKRPLVVGPSAVRRVKVATASATLKPGQRKKVKLKLTKDGRRVLYLSRKLSVTLELTVTRNGRSATQRFKTTIKAPKRKRR